MKNIDTVISALKESLYEVEFILKETNYYYYGQGEYRINGYRENGTNNLWIDYSCDMDLSCAASKVLVYLKRELAKCNRRIIHEDVFEKFISDLCDCISSSSDFYCICGRISNNGLSLSYKFLLMKKTDYNFDGQYMIIEGDIKKYPVIDLLVSNAYLNEWDTSNAVLKTTIDILKQYNLPTLDELIFYSTLKYEGRDNTALLLFNFKDTEISSDSVLFESKIRLDIENSRHVRKVMAMSDTDYALGVEDGQIKMLCNIKNVQKGFIIKFNGERYWSLYIDNIKIFIYDGKKIIYNLPKIEETVLFQSISKQFPHLKFEELKKIEYVINIASLQKHGTSIIIFNDYTSESERLYKLQRGIKIKKLNLYNNSEFIKQITAIDGAFFIDKFAFCSMVGVLVDGECIEVGNQARGARYNSIYNYIALKKQEGIDCMAVIISEDGMIDTVCTNQFSGKNKRIE